MTAVNKMRIICDPYAKVIDYKWFDAEVIDSINEKKTVKDELISKIIIWKKSKGDF